jgi:ABC-type dipeptide/oligopeptide/nickel transport system ATPase component
VPRLPPTTRGRSEPFTGRDCRTGTITHELAVVRQVVDRVDVPFEGRVVDQGPVDEILDNPRHEYTEKLIASVPRPGEPGPPASLQSEATEADKDGRPDTRNWEGSEGPQAP